MRQAPLSGPAQRRSLRPHTLEAGNDERTSTDQAHEPPRMICLPSREKSDLLQKHGTSTAMTHALKRKILLSLVLAPLVFGRQPDAQPGAAPEVWIATWGASQQIPE